MPTNYVLGFNIPVEKKQVKLFKKAEDKTEDIVKVIKSSRNKRDRETSFYRIITNARGSYNKWMSDFENHDSKFFLEDEKCTSCGNCEKVCPVNNIVIKNKRPDWKHNGCEQCLACIHACGSEAIQYGEKTKKGADTKTGMYPSGN